MLKELLLMGTLLGHTLATTYSRVSCTPGDQDIYQFSATLLDESATIDFQYYVGKVVLIYNVATYCNCTINSYNQINALLSLYEEQDLVIIGFPCNLFGKQEPGDGYDEITNGIKYVRPGLGFVPEITLFEKSDVNGANEIPLYTFLKSQCSYTDDTFMDNIFYTPVQVGDVIWNFEKFLIGRDGKPYTRYHPTTTNANDLVDDISILLSQELN